MKKQLLLAFSITLFLIGCKKDSDTIPKPVPPSLEPSVACDLIRVDGQNGAYITFQYDADNRLKATHHHQPATPTVPGKNTAYIFHRDSNNSITQIIEEHDRRLESRLLQTFEYDSKGRWIKTTDSFIPASNSYTTVVPEYNDQDMIIKATSTLHNGDNVYVRVRTYEYKDGDLIRSREIANDNVITSEYEYYPDKERKLSESIKVSSYGFGLGTPSRHLLKSIKTFNYSQLTETTYSYVTTSHGYVLKQTMAMVHAGNPVGNSEQIYAYKCNE